VGAKTPHSPSNVRGGLNRHPHKPLAKRIKIPSKSESIKRKERKGPAEEGKGKEEKPDTNVACKTPMPTGVEIAGNN